MGVNRIYKKNQIALITGKCKGELFNDISLKIILKEKERKQALKKKYPIFLLPYKRGGKIGKEKNY